MTEVKGQLEHIVSVLIVLTFNNKPTHLTRNRSFLRFPVSQNIMSSAHNDSSLADVKGQVNRLQSDLRQRDERIADLERECRALEFCIQELRSALEEGKRPCAGVGRDPEQDIAEKQQQKFPSDEREEKTCAASKQQGPEIERKDRLIRNLEQEVTRLKQEAEGFGAVKVTCDEVSRLQRENESKGERVKILEQQLVENQTALNNLQAEVSTLKGVVRETEEKERTDTGARLAKVEAELAAVQQEAHEARKREVERRRELLAVAEEALAQKEAELKKREAEINR